MSAALALPPCPDSPIARLDARWRLAALTVAVLIVPTLRTLPTAVVALLGAVLLAVLAHLPRRWAIARLGTLLLVLVPFLIWVPLVGGAAGWWSALVLLLKGTSVGLQVLVGLTTAPLPTTLKAARALHIPGPLVHLAMLTLRYVFVLSAELNRLRVALRVRGYRNRATLHCYRTVGHVAGTLLVRGAERAERVGHAMRCRGFDGQYRSMADFHTRLRDVIACGLIAGTALTLLVMDWCS